jgi:hypothetical protein
MRKPSAVFGSSDRGKEMAKGRAAGRQKDISRVLRNKKRIPPPEKSAKERRDAKK